MAWLDSVIFNPVSTGTADFVVSAAVTGYMTPAGAAAVTGGIYKYRAESNDLSQWEIGIGTYNAGTTTLARTSVMYNSSGTGTLQSGAGSKISFTAAPNVGIVALKEDLLSTDENNGFSAAAQMQARANISAVLSGHIFGLTLSTAGASAFFGVAAGECADSTGNYLMKLPSAYTKVFTSGAFAWVVGTSQTCLDTGTFGNGWYHVYIIKRLDTGVVDLCISLSATGPNLTTGNIPANYTLWRRIGSIKLESSAWRAFVQFGDTFLWAVRNIDANGTTSSATALLVTCLTPPGVQVDVMTTLRLDYVSIATSALVTSPDESDQAATGYVQSGTVTSTLSTVVGVMQVRTNTSSQIRIRSSGAGAVYGLTTTGWIDLRGRLA